LSILEHTA